MERMCTREVERGETQDAKPEGLNEEGAVLRLEGLADEERRVCVCEQIRVFEAYRLTPRSSTRHGGPRSFHAGHRVVRLLSR